MTFMVPNSELRFRASRAGGPGGQHANKTSTRVEAAWDVRGSPSLTEDQRERLLRRLAGRIDGRGVLRVAAGERRSQLLNRETAVRRLNALVDQALRVPRPRRRTAPPREARERRLVEKKRRGEIKRRRGRVEPDE
jgi:ribosome-associated protein